MLSVEQYTEDLVAIAVDGPTVWIHGKLLKCYGLPHANYMYM